VLRFFGRRIDRESTGNVMNTETSAVASALATDETEPDLLTRQLAHDYYDAKALYEEYEQLSGSAPETVEKRQKLARRIVEVLTIGFRVRQQVLYPAAEAYGVPRGLLLDARGNTSEGLELLGSGPTARADQWETSEDPWSVDEEQKDDELAGSLWGLLESFFGFEAEYFLPSCRIEKLTETLVALQLAIRKRELIEEAGLSVNDWRDPLMLFAYSARPIYSELVDA